VEAAPAKPQENCARGGELSLLDELAVECQLEPGARLDEDWLSSYVEQFVTFENFFGTFLRSRKTLLIPTSKVCRWRFFTICSMQHEYQITLQ
jgi:hypothetical protein